MKRRAQRGFSMVETVAALTVLAAGASIVFSWMAQTTTTLARVDRAQVRHTAHLRALDYMRSVDLARVPAGEQDLGDLKLRWSSEMTAAARPARSNAGAADAYDVGLARVSVQLDGNAELNGYSFAFTAPTYALTRPRDRAGLLR
jgi:prepilin-type N-terminal cleavage/methylation domain-containing protein